MLQFFSLMPAPFLPKNAINSISVMRRRSELNLNELPFYGRNDLSSLYDRMKTLSLNTPFKIVKEGQSINITLRMLVMWLELRTLRFKPRKKVFSSREATIQ